MHNIIPSRKEMVSRDTISGHYHKLLTNPEGDLFHIIMLSPIDVI